MRLFAKYPVFLCFYNENSYSTGIFYGKPDVLLVMTGISTCNAVIKKHEKLNYTIYL